MIEVLHPGQASLDGAMTAFSREDHRLRELSLVRGNTHIPRRSQTLHETDLAHPPTLTTILMLRQQPEARENCARKQSAPSARPVEQETERWRAPTTRPPLGPPRRSYSVTDKQPIPRRRGPPGARLQLVDLPAELHYAIFDFLDPIDSTCLGLTNKHMYAIHRRLNGTVPLTARRDGPNDLEWTWHLAGRLVQMLPPEGLDGSNEEAAAAPLRGLGPEERNVLSRLRVRGQAYCRLCGVTRCQLHKHVQEWMGDGLEYCCVKQKFGPVAPEGAKSYCYLSRPGDRTRCGRHFVRKGKVELR